MPKDSAHNVVLPVDSISPGAYGFLGFNCFLANLLKTPVFFFLIFHIKKGNYVLSDWLKTIYNNSMET